MSYASYRHRSDSIFFCLFFIYTHWITIKIVQAFYFLVLFIKIIEIPQASVDLTFCNSWLFVVFSENNLSLEYWSAHTWKKNFRKNILSHISTRIWIFAYDSSENSYLAMIYSFNKAWALCRTKLQWIKLLFHWSWSGVVSSFYTLQNRISAKVTFEFVKFDLINIFCKSDKVRF